MALKDTWKDLEDAVQGDKDSGSDLTVKPINDIAHTVIEIEKQMKDEDDSIDMANIQYKDAIIIGHYSSGANYDTCDVLYQDGSDFVDTFNSACEIATEKGINTIKILSGNYICSKPFYIEKEVNIIGDAMPYIYLSPETEKDFEDYENGLIQITASNVEIDGVKIGIVPQDHSLGIEGDNIKINGVVCEGNILLYKDFGDLISNTCKSVIAMEEVFEEGGSKLPKNCIIANNIIEKSIDVPSETNVIVGNIIAGAPQAGGAGGETVELDTTLTQEGKAADAKAVGDAVNAIQERIDKIQEDNIGNSVVVQGKNLFNPAKLLRNGDGNIDANTGEIVDGSYYVYGKYDLTVGETYTISKTTGNAVWLYFYNADDSYGGVGSIFAMSVPETEKTFEATYPLVVVVSLKEPTVYNIQLELGETATDYEPFYISLNENIKIPIVGDEELATDSKTLKGAINEVKKDVDEAIELGANISENTDSIFEIEKVLPRLNEEIIGFEDGFINADGSMGSSDYFLHSNKILLRSGKTYNV